MRPAGVWPLFLSVITLGIATPSLSGLLFVAIYRLSGTIIDPHILMAVISVAVAFVAWALLRRFRPGVRPGAGTLIGAIVTGFATSLIVYYAVLFYWVSTCPKGC